MTEKECGHDCDDQKELVRNIIYGIMALVVIILIIIFLFWVITKPTKPAFVLQDATVYAFNLSSPNTLTSRLQVTLSSRNPNDKIGIYYDRLDVYASYRGQQISLATMLPASYQGHKDINVWSPYLYGNAVPISPYLCDSLTQDLNTGMVLVDIKINGKVRWRVGTFVSSRYHLNGNCPAYISFGQKSKGIGNEGAVKYQFVQKCHIEV